MVCTIGKNKVAKVFKPDPFIRRESFKFLYKLQMDYRKLQQVPSEHTKILLCVYPCTANVSHFSLPNFISSATFYFFWVVFKLNRCSPVATADSVAVGLTHCGNQADSKPLLT